MTTRTALYASLAIAAVGLLAACSEDTPAKPSQPSATPFTGIQVLGPDSIEALQSVQFVANVQQADGTTKSATSMPSLKWTSSKPWVMSVNNSGVVTATSAYGEAVITAEFISQTAVRGTRDVVVRNPMTLEVSQSGTEPHLSYVFALKLTEAAGVPQTVTDIWISFEDGWGGQCTWFPYKLGPTRLPANGTLALEPLTCGDFYQKPFDVVVALTFTDDNGRVRYVELYRKL